MAQDLDQFAKSPHSAAYFGPQRNFWWNDDFLDLLAKRVDLRAAESLLDVGCGLGHWSRLLYRYLKGDAHFLGIDREQEWVKQAPALFHSAYPDVGADRIEFKQGDALDLPVESNSFDVVTCQTVLMHLSDPARGLRELVRVAKPGGLVLVIEPNNLFNELGLDSVAMSQGTEELVRRFEFWLRYQRGKVALGEGDNSLGELVPGMFAILGLQGIQVYLRDKAFPIYAPYLAPEQQALLAQEDEWERRETGPWDPDELRRYFLAGGGTVPDFNQFVEDIRHDALRRRQEIAAAQYHAAGGGLVYIVAGRKP